MGEPFGVVARFSFVDACFKLEDTLNKVYHLVEPPLDRSSDVSMHEESHRLRSDDNVLPSPLDHSHTSLFVDYPPSPEYHISVLINNPMIFNAALD